MPNLRKSLIRLALKQPQHRKDLFQVLLSQKQASAVEVGQTVEAGSLRIHRYRPSVEITDLTYAGKRGKWVDHFSIGFIGNETNPREEAFLNSYLGWVLQTKPSFAEALVKIKALQADMTTNGSFQVYLEEHPMQGVDVMPAGFEVLKIMGKFVEVQAGYDSFHVFDLVDRNNEPACIPAIKGGKASIPVFYRWVKLNQEAIKTMKFEQVTSAMDNLGIPYHYYCRMD